MPDIFAIAGKAAGIISFIAFIPYIVSILRKKTVPNRASWWIWAIVGFMLAGSYYSSGAEHTIWVPVSYAVGPLITAILSIKYGEGGWTVFDRWCVTGAVVSLIPWFLFNSPLIALLINLFIDFLGALPTIRKAYRKPEDEDRLAWILFFTGNTINMLSVGRLDFAIVVYPVYMFLASGLITAFLFFRPREKELSNDVKSNSIT